MDRGESRACGVIERRRHEVAVGAPERQAAKQAQDLRGPRLQKVTDCALGLTRRSRGVENGPARSSSPLSGRLVLRAESKEDLVRNEVVAPLFGSDGDPSVSLETEASRAFANDRRVREVEED